jgi:hypothetical protein
MIHSVRSDHTYTIVRLSFISRYRDLAYRNQKLDPGNSWLIQVLPLEGSVGRIDKYLHQEGANQVRDNNNNKNLGTQTFCQDQTAGKQIGKSTLPILHPKAASDRQRLKQELLG